MKTYFNTNKPNDTDMALFFRQFSTLISASVPILQCFDILEKSQAKISMRLLIHRIKRELLAGKSLSLIFKHHEGYINEFCWQLIRLGERTGKLDVTLETIASHLEKNLQLLRRIKQALFYPCIILLTGIALIFCMLLFVIPLFANLFQQSQVSLPPLTRFIFYLSSHCMNFLFIICIFIASVIVLIKYKVKVSLLTSLYAHIPLLNACKEKIRLARFTRHLAMTFDAGLPITDALRLASSTYQHKHFMAIIDQVIDSIQAGNALHRALATHHLFPVMMIQMIKIGEQSGMLVMMLDKVADFLENDINQSIDRFTKLLEPLIMLVLGALIGGLIIAMYLPIFKLGSAL